MAIIDEINRLKSAKTSIAIKLNSKGADITTERLDSFPEIIDTVSFLPTEEDNYAVEFIDYDGSLIAEHKISELPLSELPAIPEVAGLSHLGYNWTLEEVNSLTTPATVGVLRVPADGLTHIFIDLKRENFSASAVVPQIQLRWRVNSSESGAPYAIDWGDGTVDNFVVGTTTAEETVTASHEYPAFGLEYEIKIVKNGQAPFITILPFYVNNPFITWVKKLWFAPGTAVANSGTSSNLKFLNLAPAGLIDYGDPQKCFHTINTGPLFNTRKALIISRRMSELYDFNNLDCLMRKHADDIKISPAPNTFKYGFYQSGDSYWLHTPRQLSKLHIPFFIGKNSGNGLGFAKLENLEKFILPPTTQFINNLLFKDCTSLSYIKISEGVKRIGDSAFESCVSLPSITLPNSVEQIGNYAFAYCTLLSSFTLPSSVLSVGAGAFRYCTSLSSFTVPETSSATLGNIMFLGCKKLKHVILSPNNVISDLGGMFTQCSSLLSVELPNGTTISGNSTFQDCSSLFYVKLPTTLIGIGTYMFKGCGSLSQLNIPQSVTTIGMSAFESSGLFALTLPAGVVSIDKAAFKSSAYLKTINIPSGISIINDETFSGCTSLEAITIPASVVSIGKSAFYNCSSLGSLSIPSGVTSIAESAFSNCSFLTSVVLPDSVTSMGTKLFQYCSLLSSVVLPSSLTALPDYTFYECSALTDVTIPPGVTSIGLSAFGGCKALTSIVLPDGLQTISNYAFSNCNLLSSIIIPASVTSMGTQVFSGNNLIFESLTMRSATPPTLSGILIINPQNFINLKIYIPAGSLNAYSTATNWSLLASKFVEY